MYQGRRGCGKTLTLVKDATNYYYDGWKIYSNMFTLKIPHKYISEQEMLSINKESKINDCVLIVDEIQLLLESRRSMKKENISFSNFIQQIRKRNIILLCTTQFTGTVDLRLRQHIDIRVTPRIDKKLHVVEATYYDMTSIEDYGLTKPLNNIPQNITVVFDAMQVYGKYNTREML